MATPISPPLPRTSRKKASTAGQTPAKRPSFSVTPSFVPRLHITGTFSAASGKVYVLIVGRSGIGLSSGTPERSHAAATRSGCSSTMPPAQWPPPLCPHSAHGTWASSGWPDFAPRSTRHLWNAASEPFRGSHHIWQSAFSGCS